MSTPTTCGKRDMLSHVLFGGNLDFVARLIEESVINVSREYPGCTGVAEALQLLRPQGEDSLHRLQIKLFILLNEDETMRRNLSNVKEKGQTGSCPARLKSANQTFLCSVADGQCLAA